MKCLKLLPLFVLVIGLMNITSCSDDDSGANCADVMLAGEINGKPFEFGYGLASLVGNEMVLNFFHNRAVQSAPCSSGNGGAYVSISGSIALTTVGRIELSDLGTPGGEVLLLFDPEETLNIIASEGFVEFTSVSDVQVEGYLFASLGPGDEVCGRFILERCD